MLQRTQICLCKYDNLNIQLMEQVKISGKLLEQKSQHREKCCKKQLFILSHGSNHWYSVNKKSCRKYLVNIFPPIFPPKIILLNFIERHKCLDKQKLLQFSDITIYLGIFVTHCLYIYIYIYRLKNFIWQQMKVLVSSERGWKVEVEEIQIVVALSCISLSTFLRSARQLSDQSVCTINSKCSTPRARITFRPTFYMESKNLSSK